MLVGSTGYVSPSQLHEIKGSRLEAGAEVIRTKIKTSEYSSTIESPTGTFLASYGNEQVAVALNGSYLQGENDANGAVDIDEKFKSQKLIPQLAYTIGKYVTLGGAPK